MKVGDINLVQETAYGFRTKLLFFIERIEHFRRNLDKEKNEIKILDIGCSNGVQMTFPLGAEGYEITGIDMHEPSIEFAKKSNIYKNVRFILDKIENLKSYTEAEKFDVVILSDILEHIENPKAMLKEIKSILHKHGIVFISIPNGYGPFEIENFILRKLGVIKLGRFLRRLISKKKIPYNAESGHVQFFTRRNFSKILSDCGFVITHFRNGCFLGGSISNFVISKIPFLTRFNIWSAKYLPAFLCSAWYFECRLKSDLDVI